MDKDFVEQRYTCIAHGVGLVDEYPILYAVEDWEECGYDDVLVENMVLAFESYIGYKNGTQGVKLEDQVCVTKDGFELMTTFPYEERMIDRSLPCYKATFPNE